MLRQMSLGLRRHELTQDEISDPNLDNLIDRIARNRSLLDDLLLNDRFQNIFILMRQESVPDELLLEFFTGKVSLEECLGEGTWRVNFLVRSYGEFEAGYFDNSHFLKRSLASLLSSIFSSGVFEPRAKTSSKMITMIRAIEAHSSSKNLHLEDADFCNTNLSGANFKSAFFVNVGFTGAN
ncbi:MAG: hypothetical protein K0R08_984 [Solimicrobium sp.]|jgi:uncharacterized protein YjbI with pentapeptide repeats|nr:hypothetical protein [Solimicrobium sp.]